MNKKDMRISETISILSSLGLPSSLHNSRSALTLLAILNLDPTTPWQAAQSRLMGVTQIIEWMFHNYEISYAPNTRETIRRQTIHQLVDAGVVLRNPDDLARPVNSPKTVYQIEENALSLLQTFGGPDWRVRLHQYLECRVSLAARYAREREAQKVSVVIDSDEPLSLSPGAHSELIKAIVEDFGPIFTPGADLIYVGDTASKWAFFDRELLSSLGVTVDLHGKMPDVILYDSRRNWLILVEAVTSHGPVDAKRHEELEKLFERSVPGIVYVTAFPSRVHLANYVSYIGWETEVWVADAPTHLIHFNGVRFLGPYS